MTSSPGFSPRALMARSRATVPLFTAMAVFHAQVAREFIFKPLDALALGEHAAFQHISYSFYLFVAYDGLGYGNKISHQVLLEAVILIISILCSSFALKRFVVFSPLSWKRPGPCE